MAKSEGEQLELPPSGNPFKHPKIRMDIQAAIMDEIIVDTFPTTVIRVPEALVDRLEAILGPFCNG